MRVFLTGATGFIGSAIIPELLAAGHRVLGLTRSDAGAQTLQAAGAEVHRGTLEDPTTLQSGAAQADAVIHCAFDHENFADFVGVCEKDRRNIEAMGEALKGSDRPFLITSGVGLGTTTPGQPGVEDVFDVNNPHPRKLSEIAANDLLDHGVNVAVVRLPQVHDPYKQGLIPYFIKAARDKGRAVYVGEGQNRFAAAHISDVARLYRLALERTASKTQPGARYNAVAEEGVTARAITESIGRGLNLPVSSISPEEAPAHFGWVAMFANLDLSASSALTRERLHWTPTGPTLLEDLDRARF